MPTEYQLGVIPHIIEQHAEEAAFLWLLRDSAVGEAHYNLNDLDKLEGRLEANIDGLRVSGDYGYQLILDQVNDYKEAGEMFIAALLAYERHDVERIKALYRIVIDQPETLPGLVSALGWLDQQQMQGQVAGLLRSENPFWRRLGLAACAVHRFDPGESLAVAIKDKDPALCCCALQIAGELGRRDLHTLIKGYFGSDNVEIRFWAAWAAALIGDRDAALKVLQHFLLQADAQAEKAAQLLFRLLPAKACQQAIQTLHNTERRRLALQACGIAADPRYIPWLIEQMAIPELTRVAGESFSLITGIDLAYDDLETDQPVDFLSGPTEFEEGDGTDLDVDENLPWPDAALIHDWWRQHQHQFTAQHRYLMGRPVSAENCHSILKTATQRQRYAAAIELALMDPEAPLFEIKARSTLQFENLQ